MNTKLWGSAVKALAICGLIATTLSSGCGGGNQATESSGAALTSSFTINIATKAGIGQYLVDSNGMTLYWTTLDAVGKSNVTGSTLATWPVYYAGTGNFIIPGTMGTFNFDNIVRDDGSSQTTYKGWPLYYYSNDKVAGDTGGQGLGGAWFAVNPSASTPGK